MKENSEEPKKSPVRDPFDYTTYGELLYAQMKKDGPFEYSTPVKKSGNTESKSSEFKKDPFNYSLDHRVEVF